MKNGTVDLAATNSLMSKKIFSFNIYVPACQRLDCNFNRQFECVDIPLRWSERCKRNAVSIKHPQMADILLHNISIDRRMHASITHIHTQEETSHTTIDNNVERSAEQPANQPASQPTN